jgi:hypothetical protein
MSRHLARTVLAAAAIAVAAPVAAVEAATVTCAQVITTSITVDNDLTNCPGKGLVVGADNITIDFNGHTIDGDETGVPRDQGSNGIEVGPYDGVTVRNGRITDFNDGVRLSSQAGVGTGAVVVVNSFARNARSVTSGGGNIIAFNRGESGEDIHATGGTEVAYNVIPRIVVGGATRVEHNQTGHIFAEGDRTYIANNVVSGGEPVTERISARAGSRMVVEYNRVIGGDIGISINGSANIARRNLVLGARQVGIQVWTDYNSVSSDNVLLNNTVSRGALDGIVVWHRICDEFGCFEPAVRTLLRHNRTRYNAGDGIRVGAPQTTLVRNIARHNGDLGIEAVAGVTDGGENRAALNGNPAQCVGVVCGP